MSYASGRGWRALGSGLENIGALLVQREERDRERRRQDAAAARAAPEQQRVSAPAIEFTPPRFGESFPRPRTETGIAAPPRGFLREGGGPAPSRAAPAPLANIGKIALGPTPAPTRMRGLADTFQPGGFIQTGPSAADRASMVEAEKAGRIGRVVSALVPAVGAMTPEGQTLVGAGEIPLAAVTAAQGRQDTHAQALAWLRKYPDIPAGIGDEAIIRAGVFRDQQSHDLPPAGAGSPPAPTQAQLDARLDRSRDALYTAQRGAPARPDYVTPAAEQKFVRDSSLAAQQVGRLQERVARDSTAAAGTPAPAPVPVRPPAPVPTTKTPADWLREVAADPNFRTATREQRIAEAQRRARGGR